MSEEVHMLRAIVLSMYVAVAVGESLVNIVEYSIFLDVTSSWNILEDLFGYLY